jgi:enoyl-CoA hydratase/carnithine racemase
LAFAQTIAGKLASAVTTGKSAFYAQAQMSTADAYVFTGQVMVDNMANADTNEGINAFLEKRTPDWT